MDVRNWPLDRIMQLPDCAFGRRWPIGLQAVLSDAAAVFDIAEAALPERCVIWQLYMSCSGLLGTTSADFTLALGDVLPATVAEFNALELVFSGVESVTSRGGTEAVSGAPINLPTIRMPLVTAGCRFVGRFIRVIGSATAAHVIIIVSSIPREVPDCLL